MDTGEVFPCRGCRSAFRIAVFFIFIGALTTLYLASSRLRNKHTRRGNTQVLLSANAVASAARKSTIVANSTHMKAKRQRVAVVTVSDKAHIDRYVLQQATMRAYALENGYDYKLINPKEDAPECEVLRNFFFKKHW